MVGGGRGGGGHLLREITDFSFTEVNTLVQMQWNELSESVSVLVFVLAVDIIYFFHCQS